MAGHSQKSDIYSGLARFLHWASALFVLGLIPMGYIMGHMDFSPVKLQVFTLHKSFGMTVFALALTRIIWRFISPPPISLETHALWEKLLAKLIHILLYAALIGMPLSGWLMSSAGEFPVSYFGLFNVPDLIEKDKEIFSFMREVHELTAYILFAAVLLHFTGALKHHVIDRDVTLQRMLPLLSHKSISVAVLAALFVVVVSSYAVSSYYVLGSVRHALFEKSDQGIQELSPDNSQAEAIMVAEQPSDVMSVKRWNIVSEKSHIKFTGSVYGSAFTGQFHVFSGDIAFDPERLSDSHVYIKVGMSDFESGSAERDSSMKNDIWFSSESFTESHFKADEFEYIDENQYVARGFLTIKGIEKPQNFIFTLDMITGEGGESVAIAKGNFVINRLDFDIGTGEWANPDNVATDVTLDISLYTEQL